MKGIILIDREDVNEQENSLGLKVFSSLKTTNHRYTNFPSIAFGPQIQKEDTYRFAKRDAEGKMRRIGFVGYTLSIPMKWGLLTSSQYDMLFKTMTEQYFYVKFKWQGEWRTEPFYAGNLSATPFKLSNTDGAPIYYKEVSFNAITRDTLKYGATTNG